MLENPIRKKRIRLLLFGWLLSIRMEQRYVKLETHRLVKENQSHTSSILRRKEEKMVDRRVVCVEVRSLFTEAVQTRERKRRRGEKETCDTITQEGTREREKRDCHSLTFPVIVVIFADVLQVLIFTMFIFMS
jgi:hypothetical protein